jgi:hypothetical protein
MGHGTEKEMWYNDVGCVTRGRYEKSVRRIWNRLEEVTEQVIRRILNRWTGPVWNIYINCNLGGVGKDFEPVDRNRNRSART